MNLANTRKESYVELGGPALTFLRSKAKIVAAHVLLDSRPIDFTQKQMRSSVNLRSNRPGHCACLERN
jgi:hypothetical protein